MFYMPQLPGAAFKGTDQLVMKRDHSRSVGLSMLPKVAQKKVLPSFPDKSLLR